MKLPVVARVDPQESFGRLRRDVRLDFLGGVRLLPKLGFALTAQAAAATKRRKFKNLGHASLQRRWAPRMLPEELQLLLEGAIQGAHKVVALQHRAIRRLELRIEDRARNSNGCQRLGLVRGRGARRGYDFFSVQGIAPNCEWEFNAVERMGDSR